MSEGNGHPPLRLLPGPDDVSEISARELHALVLDGALGYGMAEALARSFADDAGGWLRLRNAGDAPPLPPNLAEIWGRDLDRFLDPDPYLLRMADAGMGRMFDRLLGGGLSVGQTCAIVSAGAGVGKTALLHQIADGVADASAAAFDRAAETGTTASVVPVVFVSEMSKEDMSLRALARRSGVAGYLLRDPKGEHGCRPLYDGCTYGQDALEQARRAARAATDAAAFLTPLDRRTKVTVQDLERLVHVLRAFWRKSGASVPAVLVVVDPVHRLLDPTRPEVEALGTVLPQLLDLAQRAQAIVMFASDTTRAAASSRSETTKLGRADQVADAVEMAFRGSYQLLHLPDVALGLITVRADDEALGDEDRNRLEREPEGTLYAEVVNAKSRWDSRGQRAAYFLDPAMFRYRAAGARSLGPDTPLRERIVDYVTSHPRCSESSVRKNVVGRVETIRRTVVELLAEGTLVDYGSTETGRRLSVVVP